jgi:hypothetical protein
MIVTPAIRKAAIISATFTLVLGTIIGLLFAGIITFPVALLMLMGVIGICVGVGILVAAWRITGNID